MRRRYVLLYTLFLVFQTIGAKAQSLVNSRTNSYYTIIYKLDNEQAGELYDDVWNLENSYLNIVHDIYPTDSIYKKKLPIGHYLFVSAVGGEFTGQMKSVDNIDMKVLNNHRDLMLVFYDSTGKEIRDAQVSIKRKNIRFDSRTKSYRQTKSNRRGLVSVNYKNHTSYFEIDRQYNKAFFVRTGRKIIRSFPVRDIISPVVYIRNNIRNLVQGGRLGWPPIVYRLTRPHRPRIYKGFIAFNKPVYKPGDTVKLKAFIATQKGKPYKKLATINLIQSHPPYSSRKLQTIDPFRPGAYKFEFKISDTLKLQLDNSYTIEFARKNRTLISNRFQFEDYELKNNVYSFRSENSDAGKSGALYLKGTDSNQMPLFDVRAEILIRPSKVNTYYQQNIFVKDTLWSYQTKLESIGETKVIVPDSIMPNASIAYEAEVCFLNSDNERVVRKDELSFDKKSIPISISIENDSILVSSSNPNLTLSHIRLDANQAGTLLTKHIDLPFKEKLNYFIDTYWVNYGERNKSLIVGRERDELQILASRTKDSVFIVSENPRRIPFRYFLFRNRSLILEGESERLTIRKRTNASDTYSLSIQYVWGGESQTREFNIPFDKQNLDIRIDHPPIVFPGENAAFTVSVNDAFGEPVENADLTAYAITKKFSSYGGVSVPDFFKPKRMRSIFNEFNSNKNELFIRKRLEYAYWRSTLGLDSITFYKFMFPDSGYFEDRSSTGISQFAPFVVGFGHIETVVVAYVDGDPVYYKGVGTVQPYSFAIKPGLHKIQLRMSNALITVNNVRIDSAQKLIFSINRYKLPKQGVSIEMPYKFTDDELAKLSRHFVEIRWNAQHPSAYVSQGSRFHVLGTSSGNYYGTSQLAGPFFRGKTTHFERDAFHLSFDYEPFYNYEFNENILKMREFNTTGTLKSDRLGWYSSATPLFTDMVFTKKTVEEYWKRNQNIQINTLSKFPAFTQNSKHVGKLTLDYFGDQRGQFLASVTFVINLDKPDEYYVLPNLPKGQQLNEGTYQVVVLLPDNKYLKADSIIVQSNGTNYYNLFGKYKPQEPDSFSIHVLRLIEKGSGPGNYPLRERQHELQKVRSLYYQEGSASYAFTHSVTGRITDEDGEGIPGVNVVIKGTTSGTGTDMNGYYTIKCPPGGSLVFSFIGYRSGEEKINNEGVINVKLMQDVAQLSEVVVAGYASGRSGMFATSQALAGKAAGILINGAPGLTDSVSIRIRGLSSTNGNQEPLVILDGRIVRLADVDSNLVTAIEIMKGVDGMALYGSRAANGVILMSTKPGATKAYLKEMSKAITPIPMLEDVPGNALRKNFRDYAFWEPSLKTDENGKATFHATFPDDVTGWNAYVLGMATKRRTGQGSSTIQSYKAVVAQIAQPHFLIEGDQSKALGKITNYSQEKIQLNRTIKIDEKEIANDVIELTTSRIDTISLNPSGPDSVSVEYTVGVKNYKDGELRKIPVFRKGTLEANGQFFALDTDTTFAIDLSDKNQSIKLYAQADLVDVLADEIKYLKEYPYECNEQLASKLRGRLFEKAIDEFKKFNFPANHDIQKIIRKLITNQNDDGSWGWWKGGSGEIWITLHVARGLLSAEKEGFKTPIDKDQLIDYFQSKMNALSVSAQFEVMDFLVELGKELKVKNLIDSIKSSKKSSVHEKLLAERLSQSMGQKIDWNWLNGMRSKTIKGNYYWGEDHMTAYDNSIVNTLIVYEMATREGSGKELSKIEDYFMEQRRGHWRNTYESSLILETLLPGIIKRSPLDDKPVLRLSGSLTKSINSFPFEMTIPPGKLILEKSGRSPVYFTAYSEQWTDTPEPRDKEFAVRTSFGNSNNRLIAGRPVEFNIELDVKGDAEYVMIEVPIPAGCSYQSKDQRRSDGEVHREYYNHKTNIYCKYLKKGKYTYTINLLPRYSGTYTLNPAVAECMYFPTLYGRERVRQVTIK